MLVKFSAASFACLLGVALFSPAHALTTKIGGKANAIDDVVFEVIGQNSAASGQEYWCSASEFARRALNAGWRDRVYVVRGRGPSETTNRRSAVQFTLKPDQAGIKPVKSGLSLNEMKPGESMSIQQAHQFCNFFTSRF